MDRTNEFEWKVVWRDPNELIPYDKNAKLHDERQIRNIANSIKRFGWKQPGVITEDNVIVIGHGRRAAAIKIGCKMPVIVIDKVADDLTDDDIRELRLADNITNESPWDFELKETEMSELDFDGFEFGFEAAVDEEDFKTPAPFQDFDDDMKTANRCPRCGYEWN